MEFLDRLEKTAIDEELEQAISLMANSVDIQNRFMATLAVKVLEMDERQKKIIVNQKAIMEALNITEKRDIGL